MSVSAAALTQGRGKQLLTDLKTLGAEMGDMGLGEDDVIDFPDSLKDALGNKKLLKHRDSDVKLLVACCHADLLRIYAPDLPYDDEQLKEVFELLVSQLQGLEDVEGPSYERYVYLLERLAVVHSFVLMPDLGCDDLIQQCFDTLFNAANSSQSRAVKKYMLDILVEITEELQQGTLSQPLLDAILENLIEPKRSERPAAYALACNLIQQCSKQLLGPLHGFLQACLPTSVGSAPEGSELREDWRSIVVELAAISPDTVTYLLPQLEGVTQMEDEETRLVGTDLLGQLLSLDACDVARQVPALFDSAFLGRLKDVSPAVRAAAVEHAVQLIQTKPSLAPRLLEAIDERVLDADEKVREVVVKTVCDACHDHLGAMSSLVPRIAHRMADKKPRVRRAARDGLCTVYRKHVVAHLTANPSSKTAPEPLQVIAQCLVHCYGTDAARDAEARIELEALLTSKLLPSEESLRLRAFCALHHALKPAQRKALRGLLRSKRVMQQEVSRWAELHGTVRSKETSNSAKDEAKEQQKRLVGQMSARLPDTEKAKEVWDQIRECKDQRVTKQLVVLASSGSSYKEVLDAQTDVRQRMGQRIKDAHRPALDAITSLPAMTLLWSEGVDTLLNEVSDCLRSDDTSRAGGDTLALLELLVDVCGQLPETVARAAPSIATALVAAAKGKAGEGGTPGPVDASHRPALTLLLRLVHAASTQLAHAAPSVRKGIVAVLCQLCCTAKDVEVGKLAAQALSTSVLVPAIRTRTFETLLSKLTPHLEPSRPTQAQHCSLAVLGALGKRDPEEALGPDRYKLLKRLCGHALPTPTAERTSGQRALSAPNLRARCASQLLIVKLLANEALGSGALLGAKLAASKAKAAETSEGASSGTGPSPHSSQEANETSDQAAHVTDLLRRLVETLEANGCVGAAAEASEEERAQLRLAAGCAILKIARVHHLKAEASIGPLGWHRLGLCMHDAHNAVRVGFARKLAAEQMRPFLFDKRETKLGAPSSYLVARRLGLPPQYMTFLALAAVDPVKDNVKAAKGLACQLVRSWRGAAERTKQSLPNASMGLPEVQLPWLIHLLAHHPDFETEEAAMDAEEEGEHSGTLPSTQKALDFYINACLAGGANAFDLLRHVATRVKTAVDRLEPNGQATRIVSAIARQLIDYRGEKAKWSTQPIPPNLTLPALLYCRLSEQREHANIDLLPRGFTFIDGLKSSNQGFGPATVAGTAAAASTSTALVVPQGALKRKSSSGSPASKKSKVVPSPVRSGGGSSGKKSQQASGSDDVEDGGEDSSEDEDEAADEAQIARANLLERERQQRLERDARIAQRAARATEVLALPAPKEAAAKPKEIKGKQSKKPATKAAPEKRVAVEMGYDAENQGANPSTTRAGRPKRAAAP